MGDPGRAICYGWDSSNKTRDPSAELMNVDYHKNPKLPPLTRGESDRFKRKQESDVELFETAERQPTYRIISFTRENVNVRILATQRW
jgi:hypothetical protein